MHLLLVGAPGVGKSTLIRRVLKKVDRPVFGFETKKEAPDGAGGSCPVYIYPAGGERRRSEECLVGRCGSGGVQIVQEGFDRFAPYLRAPVPPGHIVLMDELGFMEAGAEAFCNAVFALLDGDAPVLAAVKDRELPFLERVRAHPKCRSFFITPENRDRLFLEVLAQLRLQLHKD